MSKRNMVGVFMCGAIFVGGFWMSGGLAVYWNLAAFLIVVAGLFAALFMSYPYERIRTAFLVAKSVYGERQQTPDDIVRILRAELVNRLRRKEEDGELVISGSDVQQLTDILAGRIAPEEPE